MTRLMPSAARTLHASLKVGGRPVGRRPACEKQLDDVGLGLSYPTGRHALFQMTAGLVVREFLVGHLRSLSGLLKNDYELHVFIANRLKFFIYDPKAAVGRKERFLLMKIRRQPPNSPRT